MMHGRRKSDSATVAVKPANNAERSAAELVEPRAETEGNAGQQSTCRAQSRVSVSQALERIRKVARERKQEKRILHPWPDRRFAVTHQRWEPYAGKPRVRICAGGAR